MAGTTERLMSQHAALLLRCQRAREARQRLAALQAERICAAALVMAASARAELVTFEISRQGEMRNTYNALAGRLVDANALYALPALEATRRVQAVLLALTLDEAAARLGKAEDVMAEARKALALAARHTQRRERLADVTAARHHAVLALAEEAAREDATTDNWRPPLPERPAA